MKLLLIEDDMADARFLRRCIARGNQGGRSVLPEDQAIAEIEHVTTMAEALRVLTHEVFDAVLLDLHLPDCSGADSVRSILGVCAEMPIVVLSGEDDEDVAIRSLKEGVQDYLVKWEGDGKSFLRSVRYAIERKRTELSLAFLANHDSLTGMYSRSYFLDFLDSAQSRAQRSGTMLGLLVVDLDRFKSVNDMVGSQVGDEVLKITAQRIEKIVRKGDVAARLAGDEFAILLEQLADPSPVEAVSRKILAALRQPFEIDGRNIVLSASIGVTVFPADRNQPDVMLQNAAIAMHQAKASGRNRFQLFTQEMHQTIVSRHEVRQSIHRALAEDEFFLMYQPQYDLSSGELFGVESLVRWRLPDGEVLPPAHFIDVAEDSGQIIELGYQVFHKACAQSVAWEADIFAPPRVAVNVSPQQIHQANFYERLRRIIVQHKVDPTTIELEITESCLLQNDDFAQHRLKKIKDLGVTIAIDDFGTGHSCLDYLRHFPIDTLKIDRCFVKDIGVSQHGTTITRAILSIAQGLGMQVVAEGIENTDQLNFLAEHGCQIGQGYLFSPPVDADAAFADVSSMLNPLPQSAGVMH